MAILVSDLLRKLDAIPKSVLEDIKSELQNISYSENCYGDDYDISSRVVSLEEACDVIDKHISGKENTDVSNN